MSPAEMLRDAVRLAAAGDAHAAEAMFRSILEKEIPAAMRGDALDGLGKLLSAQKRLEEAEKIFEEEIVILAGEQGTSHPRTAMAMHNLGSGLI